MNETICSILDIASIDIVIIMLNITSALLLLISLNTISTLPTVKVSIETDIYQYAQEVLAGQSPLAVENFTGEHSQRDVVEFILVQKALALGGLNINFSFIVGNYDARNIKLLQDGLLLINFDSMWHSHVSMLKEDVYISDAVIRKGEYWAGIYTSQENKKNFSIKSLAQFKQLTVASSTNWHVDWQTLSQMKPKALIHQEEWQSMAKLVSLGWVDVMLAPFTQKTPFSYEGTNYKIVAIEGVKVALNDSRHFVVSRKHPYGEKTFIALQKGLKILRQQGVIKKAYQQSGFFNEQVKDWLIINKSLLDTKLSAELISK